MPRYNQNRYRHPSEHSVSSRYDQRRYGLPPSLSEGQPDPVAAKDTNQATVASAQSSQPRPQKQPPIIQDIARPVATAKPQQSISKSQSAKTQPERSQVLQRSLVEKPDQLYPERRFEIVPRKRRGGRFALPRVSWRMAAGAFSMFAVFGFVGAGAAFLMNGATQNGASVLSEQAEPKTHEVQPEIFIEQEVTEAQIAAHEVGDREPAFIRINGMGAESRIFSGGVDASRQIILPENIFDVTWYQGSRAPHQPGTVILNGHVSGTSERGAFYYLRVLEHGDVIEIETGDGTIHQYEVVASDMVPHDQLDVFELLAPYNDETHALHLVATDTRYNIVTNDYQDRFVVYAIQK